MGPATGCIIIDFLWMLLAWSKVVSFIRKVYIINILSAFDNAFDWLKDDFLMYANKDWQVWSVNVLDALHVLSLYLFSYRPRRNCLNHQSDSFQITMLIIWKEINFIAMLITISIVFQKTSLYYLIQPMTMSVAFKTTGSTAE